MINITSGQAKALAAIRSDPTAHGVADQTLRALEVKGLIVNRGAYATSRRFVLTDLGECINRPR